MCDNSGDFKELDISTFKQVSSFNEKNVKKCAVTYDNKFLITCENEDNCVLTIWSIRSKKQLHIWQSGVNEYVVS